MAMYRMFQRCNCAQSEGKTDNIYFSSQYDAEQTTERCAEVSATNNRVRLHKN